MFWSLELGVTPLAMDTNCQRCYKLGYYFSPAKHQYRIPDTHDHRIEYRSIGVKMLADEP